jgi:hypothetical protein
MVNRSRHPAKEVADQPGLYQLVPANGNDGRRLRLRVRDGYAYLGLNVADAAMTPQALVSVAKVIQPNEPASLTARAFPGAVPTGFYQAIRERLKDRMDHERKFAGQSNEPYMVSFFDAYESLIAKGYTHLEKNVETITWRLNYDRKTSAFTDAVTIVPKAGTPFADEVAKWGATTNRFVGLADDSAAAWGVFKVPVFNGDIRKMATALLDGAEKEYPGSIPAPAHDLVKEAIALGKRTVSKAEGDFAVALHGPDKAGTFTLVGAVVADDPSGVEKELKALAKTLPVKDVFAFDVTKVGDVAVHEIKLGAVLPPDLQKVFGKDGTLCLGFGKSVLIAGFGPDARDRVMKAAGLKPGPAAAFDVRYNAVKVTVLAKAIDDKVGGWFAHTLGTEDKLVPFWTTTVTGGTELTGKQSGNPLVLPRWFSYLLEDLFK